MEMKIKKVRNWDTNEDIETPEFSSTDFNDVPRHASYYSMNDLTDGTGGLGHDDYDFVANWVEMYKTFRPGHKWEYRWDFRPAECTHPSHRN